MPRADIFLDDPRLDLEQDHAAWQRLLSLAPGGLRGLLHGLRCEGCSLQQVGGKWTLSRGEMDVNDYIKVRGEWLQPQADALVRLLAQMGT